MDQKTISSVCQQIYRQFPELNGVSPSIKPQGSDNTLLIFHVNSKTPDGHILPRTVRAVVNNKRENCENNHIKVRDWKYSLKRKGENR